MQDDDTMNGGDTSTARARGMKYSSQNKMTPRIIFFYFIPIGAICEASRVGSGRPKKYYL